MFLVQPKYLLFYFSYLLFAFLGIFFTITNGSIQSSSFYSESMESSKPLLEKINGTRNFRMHGRKGKDDKSWFDGREMRFIYCVRESQTKCEELKSRQCFGITLPYQSTTLDLTNSYSQEESLEKLYSYQALKNVPKCWSVIQPFLCAVFLPKCEKINNLEMVYLPSLEMCKITMEPCRVLYNTSYFPDFLKCNETQFPSKCNNDVREMKFNLTGKCLSPLVPADEAANYYKDIEGCGIECKDPLYTDDEHRQIRKLIGWGASICLTFNLFALLTFTIDWHNGNKYPALIIFYVNLCYMISCLGWLAQFLPGGREDIVCRKDNTLKQSEPSGGDNLSCIVVFILVYYFLMAAMTWFVIFTYAWHMSFKAIGKIQERIDKKASYFHLIAWSIPLVFTITIMALSEVDGNSTVGICFVGYVNHPIRGIFLIGPVLCILVIGGYFMGRGMTILIHLKISSKQIISSRASKKIRQSIVRMGVCSVFTIIFVLITVVCHLHDFKNADKWAMSLKNYIICRISSTYTDATSTCKMANRPSVSMLQLHLLCLFASGIVMASFVFTPSTVEIWGRYFRRKFGQKIEEPLKLQKHKVIAQAFAKRKVFQNQGRLSISFHNSHTDPVGLKFDMNSAIGSHDFSSTWANNLPRFVNRRYALTGCATSSSHGGHRKNSIDSEISFSVRHVSVESRRNSNDSQVSVKIAEMKTKVASRSRGSKGKSRSSRHNRRDFSSSRRYSRKESSTSVESQIITAMAQKGRHSTSSTTGGLMLSLPHHKRRSGISALDPEQINELIAKNKFLLPFLTTSEDEKSSMGSFHIQDSKLDVILKQIGLSEHKIIENKFHAMEENIDSITRDEDEEDMMEMAVRNMTNDFSDVLSSKDGGAMAIGGRNSKNSSKSGGSKKSLKTGNSSRLRKTRKSSRSIGKSSNPLAITNGSNSRKNEKKSEKDKKTKEKEMFENSQDIMDSSFNSMAMEMSPLNNLQSSYSGISMNSKQSEQEHALAIETQTLSSFEFHEKKLKNEENEDLLTENHKLLPIGKRLIIQGSTSAGKRRNTNEISLTESEKLKLLLLPSK